MKQFKQLPALAQYETRERFKVLGRTIDQYKSFFLCTNAPLMAFRFHHFQLLSASLESFAKKTGPSMIMLRNANGTYIVYFFLHSQFSHRFTPSVVVDEFAEGDAATVQRGKPEKLTVILNLRPLMLLLNNENEPLSSLGPP